MRTRARTHAQVSNTDDSSTIIERMVAALSAVACDETYMVTYTLLREIVQPFNFSCTCMLYACCMDVLWRAASMLWLCGMCVCVCVPADTVEMITPESLSDQPVRTPHVIGLYNTTMQCSHGKLAITRYNRLNKMCELSVLLIVQLLIQYIAT